MGVGSVSGVEQKETKKFSVAETFWACAMCRTKSVGRWNSSATF